MMAVLEIHFVRLHVNKKIEMNRNVTGFSNPEFDVRLFHF